MYCGHIFTDAEKVADKNGFVAATTVTKPTLVTSSMGGSKIMPKPIGFHCTKRCFRGQARQMYESWIECELVDGVWTIANKNRTGHLTLRKF